MATKKEEPKQTAAVSVPPQGGQVVPYDYGDQAGLGLTNVSQSDVGIPFLNLLQQNSPEVMDGNPKRIPGARAGLFCDGTTRELFDPANGLVIVPCETQHVFTEWIPRNVGGGFVGMHALDSEVVKKATGGRRVMGRIPLPAQGTKPATELVETFYVFCLLLAGVGSEEVRGAYVLPFTSKKIKPYREAIGQLYKFRAGVPLFAHQLLLTTFDDQNRQGQFFKNVKMAPANGTVENSLIPRNRADGSRHPVNELGFKLWESVSGGTAKVDYSGAKADEAGGDDEKADKVFA